MVSMMHDDGFFNSKSQGIVWCDISVIHLVCLGIYGYSDERVNRSSYSH